MSGTCFGTLCRRIPEEYIIPPAINLEETATVHNSTVTFTFAELQPTSHQYRKLQFELRSATFLNFISEGKEHLTLQTILGFKGHDSRSYMP